MYERRNAPKDESTMEEDFKDEAGATYEFEQTAEKTLGVIGEDDEEKLVFFQLPTSLPFASGKDGVDVQVRQVREAAVARVFC